MVDGEEDGLVLFDDDWFLQFLIQPSTPQEK